MTALGCPVRLPRWRRSAARSVAVLIVLIGGLLSAGPARASFPGSNGRIAFAVGTPAGGRCCGRFDIATMRADGGGVRVLTRVDAGVFAQHPSWSPSGESLVFDLGPSGPLNVGQIWRVNADGSGQRRLVADPFFSDFFPSYSPDGRYVLFSRCRPDFSACALYRADADGTHLTALLPFRTEIVNLSAKYSPDGQRIALASFSRGGVQGALYVMHADGSGIHRVSPAWLGGVAPDWSPDGSKLTFFSNCCTPRNSAIWRVNADGSGTNRLTQPGSRHDFAPTYSPDGTRIAFERDAADFAAFTIWEMNPDGGSQHEVGPPFSGQPAWGPAR